MSNEKTSSPLLIALAWMLVGVPLCWGIYKSGLNAAKLFQAAPPAAAASSSPTK
ncbi:MAG: hypothetical protein PW792_16795 [Acidobacteriaceae bacterium]|nr:hypothetical protein [Acidobacteriaceae bacterium]